MRNLKIWVRLTAAIWLVLVIVWTGMIIWESQVNRETAIVGVEPFETCCVAVEFGAHAGSLNDLFQEDADVDVDGLVEVTHDIQRRMGARGNGQFVTPTVNGAIPFAGKRGGHDGFLGCGGGAGVQFLEVEHLRDCIQQGRAT